MENFSPFFVRILKYLKGVDTLILHSQFKDQFQTGTIFIFLVIYFMSLDTFSLCPQSMSKVRSNIEECAIAFSKRPIMCTIRRKLHASTTISIIMCTAYARLGICYRIVVIETCPQVETFFRGVFPWVLSAVLFVENPTMLLSKKKQDRLLHIHILRVLGSTWNHK